MGVIFHLQFYFLHLLSNFAIFKTCWQNPEKHCGLAGLRALYEQVLERLIDRELIRQTAIEMQIRISSAEVDQALQNMRRQSGLDEEQFQAALAQEGMTVGQYRSEMRRQLLRLRVVNQRVRGRVNISEDDVRSRYDEARNQAARVMRFRVSHVFLSAEAQATQADSNNAQATYALLASGELTFDEAVAQIGGGELGWLSQGDLPGDLEQAIAALPVGGLSAPVQGPAGTHIFFLHERQQGDAQIAPYAELRDRIYRQLLDTAMQQQEAIFLAVRDHRLEYAGDAVDVEPSWIGVSR